MVSVNATIPITARKQRTRPNASPNPSGTNSSTFRTTSTPPTDPQTMQSGSISVVCVLEGVSVATPIATALATANHRPQSGRCGEGATLFSVLRPAIKVVNPPDGPRGLLLQRDA